MLRLVPEIVVGPVDGEIVVGPLLRLVPEIVVGPVPRLVPEIVVGPVLRLESEVMLTLGAAEGTKDEMLETPLETTLDASVALGAVDAESDVTEFATDVP